MESGCLCMFRLTVTIQQGLTSEQQASPSYAKFASECGFNNSLMHNITPGLVTTLDERNDVFLCADMLLLVPTLHKYYIIQIDDGEKAYDER